MQNRISLPERKPNPVVPRFADWHINSDGNIVFLHQGKLEKANVKVLPSRERRPMKVA